MGAGSCACLPPPPPASSRPRPRCGLSSEEGVRIHRISQGLMSISLAIPLSKAREPGRQADWGLGYGGLRHPGSWHLASGPAQKLHVVPVPLSEAESPPCPRPSAIWPPLILICRYQAAQLCPGSCPGAFALTAPIQVSSLPPSFLLPRKEVLLCTPYPFEAALPASLSPSLHSPPLHMKVFNTFVSLFLSILHHPAGPLQWTHHRCSKMGRRAGGQPAGDSGSERSCLILGHTDWIRGHRLCRHHAVSCQAKGRQCSLLPSEACHHPLEQDWSKGGQAGALLPRQLLPWLGTFCALIKTHLSA